MLTVSQEGKKPQTNGEHENRKCWENSLIFNIQSFLALGKKAQET